MSAIARTTSTELTPALALTGLPIDRSLELKPTRERRPLTGADRVPGPLLFGAARRSGTTWLSSLLNIHPELECRNEGWLFNDFGASFPEWIDERKVRKWAAGEESKGTWLRDMSVDECLHVLRRGAWMAMIREAIVREGWKDWSRLRWVGDKTTSFYCSQIDTVHRTFPDARFIHMIRDGRDVVVSDLFLLIREIDDREVPEPVRQQALQAAEYHVHGRGGPVPLLQPDVLRYLTTEWVRTVGGGMRARELYGEQFLEVRYEQLVSSTTETVGAVYRWLGVEASEELLNWAIHECRFEKHSGGRRPGEADNTAEFRKGVVGDWRNYFTNDAKQMFKSIAGELLVELGYESSMAW